jgi:hypothetical protein
MWGVLKIPRIGLAQGFVSASAGSITDCATCSKKGNTDAQHQRLDIEF